jgi:CheY-like chemotaxis protein
VSPRAPRRSSAGNGPPQAPTILVVDDDPVILDALGEALELEGYRVELATSGRQALAMMEARPPALVLLDLMLPELNGWEVLDTVKRTPRLASIPVFVVTAMAGASGLGAGHPVFAKPLKLDRMLRTIGAFLNPGRD